MQIFAFAFMTHLRDNMAQLSNLAKFEDRSNVIVATELLIPLE